MRRVILAVVLVGLTHSGVLAFQEPRQAGTAPATCDPADIDPDSYRLTTEAEALNVLRPRTPWWEPFGVWTSPREIGDVNQGALRLAERAREIDDRNLLAHGYLARQMVVKAVDARSAEEAWSRVLDNGGAITWTATLPDVDGRTFFVLAFDRDSLRIYRFTQLAGAVPAHFGFQEFPEPDREEFWRALGGCLPSGVAPEVEIPWGQVRDVRTTRRTLRFALTGPVAIESDRGHRRTDDSIEILIHGQSDLDPRFAMGPFGPRRFWGPPSMDPAAYLLRVQQMLTRFFHVRSGGT
jgi:hypothetical protein